jgi:DNA repair protein RadA/Sms
MAAFGEIGLDGTVRNVTGSSKRIDRLKESGFSEVLSPNGNIRIQNIADLVRFVGGMSDGS